MAGGSQIIISKDGITFITPRVFQAKAGQHRFESGATVSLPASPLQKPICIACLLNAASKGLGVVRRE